MEGREEAGQGTSMVKRAPVVWRQEVQWQAVAFKGRSERGTEVVKVWALQRHWAVSSIVSGLVEVGWDILDKDAFRGDIAK